MTGIAEWLASIGLGEYAQRFGENAIDLSVVRDLTEQDLKDLGVLLGHRRKMLRAIAELNGNDLRAPQAGTKAAARVRLVVPAGGQAVMMVRLTREAPELVAEPFAGADELIARRRAEADEFYEAITPPAVSDDAKSVMRQALAGMLWSKQCYYFDVDRWLRERNVHPLRAPTRRGTRNES